MVLVVPGDGFTVTGAKEDAHTIAHRVTVEHNVFPALLAVHRWILQHEKISRDGQLKIESAIRRGTI